MADFYVPISTGSIDNLNETIAKGPNLDFINSLADNYFKGKDQRYVQNQRDVFSQGLPKDANGNIDFNAVADQLARVQGASAAGNILPLQKFNLASQLLQQNGQPQVSTSPIGPPSSATAVPNSAPRQAPPQAQPTTSADVPTGTPAAPGQNLTQPNETGYSVSYGPTQTSGGGGLTPRMIAGRTGADPAQLSAALGVSPDEVIDTNDPQVRAKLVQVARNGQQPQAQPQAQPQGQPQGQPVQQVPPQPVQQAPAQAGPSGNINEATAQRYEDAGAASYRKAQAASLVDPAMSAAFKAQGDAYMKQATTIREALAKNAEATPEQKNAAPSGLNPLNYEGAKEVNKQDVDAFNKRNTGIQALGEASYNGLQKAQLMKKLTLDPNFYSGPFHEGVQTYNQFKSIFGANPSSALPQEAFNKVTNDMLTEQVKSMGQSGVGRVLQSEVNIMRQAIASLGITPQSNRALAEILSRVYQQQQDIAGISRGVPQQAGQMNRSLDTQISGYLKSHPLFTPDELQHPQLLGAPDAPPQSAQWSPQQKQAWARSIGLKSGDPIRFNGQIGQVP